MIHSRASGKLHLLAFVFAVSAVVFLACPAFAGCLCNVVSNYIDCGGTVISVSLIVSAFLMFRRNNLKTAKKMVLAGAALLTLTVCMCTSLNSSLWNSEGVIANSEAWLEGGCPAHWISLLVITIIFSVLFIACFMAPTIIAFRRNLENRKSICNMNLLILVIPGAFVIAPCIFFDLGSCFVIMFWTMLAKDPRGVLEISSYAYASIAVWNILLGIFAFAWSGLLLDALPLAVPASDPSLSS